MILANPPKSYLVQCEKGDNTAEEAPHNNHPIFYNISLIPLSTHSLMFVWTSFTNVYFGGTYLRNLFRH